MYRRVHKHLHPHIRDFVFATIDYMENDLDLGIETFPTILIYPKYDKKNPILYDMIRQYDVFLNFLENEKLGTNIYERPPPPGLKEQQESFNRDRRRMEGLRPDDDENNEMEKKSQTTVSEL